MFDWFEKQAPIRKKFDVLLLVHGGLAALGLVAAILAVSGTLPDAGLIASAVAVLVGTLVTVVVAKDRVARPYVATVVRMEALAAGDTASPIQFTDYSDCVGRMTKAMATFRDNAVKVQASGKIQGGKFLGRKIGTATTPAASRAATWPSSSPVAASAIAHPYA